MLYVDFVFGPFSHPTSFLSAMIEIKDLQKTFDDGRTVLKGISSTFENGKTSLIIGQSGSGKTVLLKCVVYPKRSESVPMLLIH